VRFEWDDAKAETNRLKHGVSFETAVLVFEDSNRLEFVERVEGGEERWQAIGSIRGSFLLLTVVHTYGEQDGLPVVRVVSARSSTPHERKLYVEAIF